MENEMINDRTAGQEMVTLELLGIDKKWVHSGKRGWINLDELKTPPLELQEENKREEVSSKKWWEFWKK